MLKLEISYVEWFLLEDFFEDYGTLGSVFTLTKRIIFFQFFFFVFKILKLLFFPSFTILL